METVSLVVASEVVLVQRNKHLVGLNFHRQCVVLQRGVDLVLAGCYVELPAMPGACDDAIRQGSLGQWAALVRANSVQGVKCSIEIEQRDDAISGDAFDGLARRTVGCMTYPCPVIHDVIPTVNLLPGCARL